MNNKRYLLTQQKYHPRGAALINVYGIAIQVYPPHPYEFVKAKQKVHVCHACGSNFTDKYYKSPNNIIIKHIDRRIRGIIGIGNLLFNADFTVAYCHFIKNNIMKKNASFSENILVKTELLDKLGSKIQEIIFTNGLTLTINE